MLLFFLKPDFLILLLLLYLFTVLFCDYAFDGAYPFYFFGNNQSSSFSLHISPGTSSGATCAPIRIPRSSIDHLTPLDPLVVEEPQGSTFTRHLGSHSTINERTIMLTYDNSAATH